MCGVLGFFVGCKLRDICSRNGVLPCHKDNYKDAFSTWETKASVRRQPRRIMDTDGAFQAPFPPDLVPITSHEIIVGLHTEDRQTILKNHIYRFLKFTQILELLVVNDVTRAIALNQSVFTVPDQIAYDAHLVYTDEAYHAKFSFDLIKQLKEHTGFDYGGTYVPPFMNALRDSLSRLSDDASRELYKLSFVVVSEMMITSMLNDQRNLGNVPIALKEAWTDHATDEARHHVFYLGVLRVLWHQLTETYRAKFAKWVPEMILAFTDPDRTTLRRELRQLHVPEERIDTVLHDCYGNSTVNDFANGCAIVIVSQLRDLGAFRLPGVTEAFTSQGFVLV